jgi:hypothetical protein
MFETNKKFKTTVLIVIQLRYTAGARHVTRLTLRECAVDAVDASGTWLLGCWVASNTWLLG